MTPSSPEFPFPNRTNYLTRYPQGGGLLIGWVNFKAIDWIMVLGVMPGEEQSSAPTAGKFSLWTLGWYSELGLGRASKSVVLQATLAVLVGNEKHSPR